MISPYMHHDIPHGTQYLHGTQDMRYAPTVLMIISHIYHYILHGTEHPPQYWTHIIQVITTDDYSPPQRLVLRIQSHNYHQKNDSDTIVTDIVLFSLPVWLFGKVPSEHLSPMSPLICSEWKFVLLSKLEILQSNSKWQNWFPLQNWYPSTH